MTFQAWKLKYFNSTNFQVFHNLYEPCYRVELVTLECQGARSL